MAPVIFWFRQDLRLGDNPGLLRACQTGPVIPIYILDDETPGEWKMGGASRWWLHHSLAALSAKIPLVLRSGNAAEVIQKLVEDTGAKTIIWNRCYEPYAIARDTQLKSDLKENGIEVESHNANLLYEPWEIKNQTGAPYKVFTPYYKACLARGEPDTPLKAPEVTLAPLPESEALESWNLLPTNPDWSTDFEGSPGEDGAHQRFQQFMETQMHKYKEGRNFPATEYVSRLSPHLHFGEISPRYLWHASITYAQQQGDLNLEKEAREFIREVIWREFSYHLLYHFDHLPTDNFNEKFNTFPWTQDPEGLKAWQMGQTGYPIVDAGMRQLYKTGYMHNRVRMIVGSFLVKNMLLHWREGEKWFWDTLLDADLASNSASWQWVAGSGADAAPYFRIFNPMLQGQRFDPDGDYVRKFVPELKDLPAKHIHTPWEAPAEILTNAGVTLGETYPKPMLDHHVTRDRALAAYETIKG